MNRKQSINAIAIGLFVAVGTNVIRGAIGEDTGGSFLTDLLKFVGILGGLVYIVGLCFYARSKNRAWAWGLTGFFCLIGGVAVALLKDKSASPG